MYIEECENPELILLANSEANANTKASLPINKALMTEFPFCKSFKLIILMMQLSGTIINVFKVLTIRLFVVLLFTTCAM